MPLKPDAQQQFDNWLESQRAVLPAEDFEQLKRIYGNPAAQESVAPTVLARSDWSRLTQQQTNEFNQKIAELQKESARLAEYERQAVEYDEYMKNNTVNAAQYNEIQAELARIKAHSEATEAKIRGLGLDELINGLEDEGDEMPTNNNGQLTQTAPSTQTGFDPARLPGNRYATKLAVEEEIQRGGVATIIAQAQLMRLTEEYKALTGKPIPNPDSLVIEALQAQKPILDYIESKLEFGKLRADQQAKNVETEIQRRVTEQLAKERAENRIPVPGGGMTGSPVLTQTIQAMNTPADQRQNIPLFGKPGQQGRGATRATEAFLQGKYRNQHFSPYSSSE